MTIQDNQRQNPIFYQWHIHGPKIVVPLKVFFERRYDHNWRPCWNQVEICPKFFQVVTRNSPTWYMAYSKLLHGFVKNVTYISRPFPNQAKVWLRFPHLQSLGCGECLLWGERSYESRWEESLFDFLKLIWWVQSSPWPLSAFTDVFFRWDLGNFVLVFTN